LERRPLGGRDFDIDRAGDGRFVALSPLHGPVTQAPGLPAAIGVRPAPDDGHQNRGHGRRLALDGFAPEGCRMRARRRPVAQAARALCLKVNKKTPHMKACAALV